MKYLLRQPLGNWKKSLVSRFNQRNSKKLPSIKWMELLNISIGLCDHWNGMILLCMKVPEPLFLQKKNYCNCG